MAARAPDFVSNAIEQRLSEIPLERAFVARFEELDPPGDLGERVLHQIFCVDRLPRPGRQTAVRPAPQARQVARTQLVER